MRACRPADDRGGARGDVTPASRDPIEFAQLPGGIVVIRVQGKGTHLVTPSLRHVFEATRESEPPTRYVVDLEQCASMDSTFMGMLASMGIDQRRRTGSSLIVANIVPHVRNLLNTLGLKHILELRAAPEPETEGQGARFTPAAAPQMTRLQRVVMMIEAHERLVDIDSNNEVKFEGVLKSLRESLRQEQGNDRGSKH